MRMLQELIRASGYELPSAKFPICVDISETLRWYFAIDSKPFYDIRNDLPSIAPPWEQCWIEGVLPKTNNGKDFNITPFVEKIGALISSTKIDPKYDEVSLRRGSDGRDMLTMMIDSRAGRVSEGSSYSDEEIDRVRIKELVPRWITVWDVWAHGRQPFADYGGLWGCYLDERGLPIEGLVPLAVLPDEWTSDRKNAVRNMNALLEPFWFALSLMHCKNVELVDIPSTPPAIAKKRAKKGIPEIKFKTLVIEPMRKQVRREKAEDGEDTSEIQRALHICRGHFKDYRENPLFGKFADVYWWEPHVRGNAKNGTVIKDYKVNAPK